MIAPDFKRAQRFRTLASTMQAAIDAKRDPGTAHQNRTPRRIRIVQQMARDADRLELVQKALRKLADAREGDWDGLERDLEERGFHSLDLCALADAASRAQVERLPWAMLQALAGPVEVDPRRAIREMEDALVGLKIDGFWPTPAETADLMVERLDFWPSDGHIVLEPSAGKGDLLEAVERNWDEGSVRDRLYACEINGRLRGILAAKGYTLTPQYDALTLRPEDRLYDRIIMNPAFEKGHDMAEVQHCFTLLKPGGRLVSIVSEGPFFRTGPAYTAFQAFLKAHRCADDVKLDSAFKGAQSFRQTSVAARIVTLAKDTD